MDKTYTPATYIADIDAIRESEKVSNDDIEILTKYIALSRIAGNELAGKTYADILGSIKKIREANKIEISEEARARELARDRMRPYLTVNITEKIFSKVNNRDCLNYTISFHNTAVQNINMVVGNISINDLLDREIKNIQIVLDEPIKAGTTIQKIFSIEYHHGNENDKQIRTKDLVDLRALWNPVKIIFEGGKIAE